MEGLPPAPAYQSGGQDAGAAEARRLAIGIYYECDFIVSWNYRHMVNITVRRLVNSVNLKMGYKAVEIISPEEVIGYGEVEI